MQKPLTVKFSHADISVDELLGFDSRQEARYVPDADSNWFRTRFKIPSGYANYDSADRIKRWLTVNCANRWRAFAYVDPLAKVNKDESIMVVYFENSTDAMLFKLQDGHRAWEQDEYRDQDIF